MRKLNIRFVFSFITISVFSWADVFFAGTYNLSYVPTAWHQPLHFIALLSTMYIGYLNWKDYPEKWLSSLWLVAYSIMIGLLALAGVLYLAHVPIHNPVIMGIIYLRNRFTWPIVFLIWYMLHLMTKYLIKKKSD